MTTEEMRRLAFEVSRATQARDTARMENLILGTVETLMAAHYTEAARVAAQIEYHAACDDLGLSS